MKKEKLNKLKKEGFSIIYLFLILVVIIKIIAFKESLLIVIRVVAALFFQFVIPGYPIMFYWNEEIGFLGRLLLGTSLSAALLGIIAYHLGLIGVGIKTLSFLLPVLLILVGIYLIGKKTSNRLVISKDY